MSTPLKKKLANLIDLPAFGSLEVKMGNSSLTDATPILQPITIDLEGSSFHIINVVKSLPRVPGTLCLIPSKMSLTTISSTIPVTLSAKDKNGLPYCYSNFKDHFSEEECNLLPPHRP
ncbi:hypothetical protein DSO57_1017147 [Entomophthora muscae]|uniref:Uncharacterized protein n=1 Tax=Entomophthora muscae TaxID=34485 RepID=A0ACC2S6W8_9FUNG|nr:hypothetical protein DSO57_1017147 [Entomophthora muscae]